MAEQWGMVTAEHARELGVSRLDLSRLVQGGTLERIEPGKRVYRLTGSPRIRTWTRSGRRGSNSAQGRRLHALRSTLLDDHLVGFQKSVTYVEH